MTLELAISIFVIVYLIGFLALFCITAKFGGHISVAITNGFTWPGVLAICAIALVVLLVWCGLQHLYDKIKGDA